MVSGAEKKRRTKQAKDASNRIIEALQGELEIKRYGFPIDPGFGQLEYELLSLGRYQGLQVARCTKFQHYKNIQAMLWPHIEWNPWKERMVESLLDNDFVSWTGCAASGKTFTSAEFAMIWWLCDPLNSAVVLTTTTRGMLKKRSWRSVQELFSTSRIPFPGNMVDSQMVLQSQTGDNKNAIFGLAVRDGNTAAAAANIQGLHTKRVLVIIDEATHCPEGIFEATANLATNQEFKMLVIGNPHSKVGDPHGRFSEPLEGWASVSVETQEWDTVNQLDGKPGLCIRFDGDRSPNVSAGKTVYPYLVTHQQVENAKNKYGPDSPLYWKFYRGFWPPDGLQKTVFTNALVEMNKAHLGVLFSGRKKSIICGCDPAFGGGDRPIIRFAEVGEETKTGRFCIELGVSEFLAIDAASEKPIHYQLADQIIQLCKSRGCKPENFAIDATGEGGGLADILRKTWSRRIIGVEFGGKPTDRRVSKTDDTKCSEAYDRKVTELWFQAREYLISGQLKGIDPETQNEFTNREYDDEGRKMKLETKKLMKERFLKSPDIADATVLVVEAARSMGVEASTDGHVEDSDKDWDEWAEEANAVYVLEEEEEHDESLAYAR